MPSLLGLLRIGASSLEAQQAGVAVSGNNIANATTKGYSRRTLTIDEGRGVSGGAVAVSVDRAEDFVLSQQLASQTGALSLASRTGQSLSAIEIVFQIGQAGQSRLASAVTDLAQALSQLTAAPGDLTRRTAVLEKGRIVAQEFNRVGTQLTQQASATTQSARDLVPAINDAAQQVAGLNRAILGSSTPGLPTQAGSNDRNQDQRDALAQKLAELAGGSLLRNPDGTYNILVNGLALVHGTEAQALSLTTLPNGSVSAAVGGQTVQGALAGQLGGLLQAGAINTRLQGQIDHLAFDLSSAINAQHALGVGLDGKGGRPFFTPLAAAAGAASQMALDPTLRADQLAAGFTAAPGDNGNALALATLIDQPVLDGGRSNFQSFYSSITATLGFDVQRAQSDESRATDQQAALSAQQQAVIGVSTDEEMAQVLAYQRAFEASSRFVQVVDEMLQRLVQLT